MTDVGRQRNIAKELLEDFDLAGSPTVNHHGALGLN